MVKDRCTDAELTFMCPQPGCGDASGNRSVNLNSGVTNCWRCGVGGNFIAWARKLGYRFDHENSVSLLSPQQLLEMNRDRESRNHVPVTNDAKLPADFAKISDEPKSVYTRLITKMAVRKNLSYEDFAEAGAGFTREDPYWEAFAIFPVFEYDRFVYYQGRTYRDVPGEPTKQFPSRKHVKYGARYWVYNIDELWRTKARTVILVESILNVLSLKRRLREDGIEGVVPLCVFKHSVSQFQFYKLMRYKEHLQEVCLMFDHDAIKASWKDAERMTNHFSVSVAEMPAGVENKKLDPNDDVGAAMQAFATRQPFKRAGSLALQVRNAERSLGGAGVVEMKNLEAFAETYRS